MKILHILDHSLPVHTGYTFRTRSILLQQHKLGWQTVHVTSSKHEPEGPNPEQVGELLFYRTKSGILAGLPILNQLDVVRTLTKRLDEIIKIEAPDILHAHSPALNGLAAIRAGRRYDLPVVYECRAFWEDAAVDHGFTSEGSLRYRLTKVLETKVFRQADAITCICEGLRSDINARGIPEDKITVIPNAVDIESFGENSGFDESLANRIGIEGCPVIGFIGSFYAYEGLALAVEALPQIRLTLPNIKLLLVGGGPQEENLKKQVRRLELENAVIFTGRVPHDQVQIYYNLVDVLVYPRLPMRLTNLVTPLKPLEAMAQRRLLVASDVGGHKELIKDGVTGKMFAAGNLGAFAESVIKMFDEKENWQTYRENGRRFVEQERNWAVSVARYRNIYEQLVR